MDDQSPTVAGDRAGSEAAQRWTQVRRILTAAWELEPGRRAAYLAEACGADTGLREEVEALLKASEQSALIDRPALAGALEQAPTGRNDLARGRKIGRYEIVRKIGEGGMGAVYQAMDPQLERPVALKIISRDAISPVHRRRFAREARSASALNHPNIITIYEYSAEGGVDYIAMEYVEGVSLHRLMSQGALPVRKILDYARQIASALAKAHAAGIVHRDLKPANIMVTSEGLVKVLDFGLAKQDEAADANSTALTYAGIVLGTPAYMSPEQSMGEATDHRSDIFSFGVILYEMLAGHNPFRGDTFHATLRKVAMKELPPIRDLNLSVPDPICHLIDQCLKKDRAERLQSMADAVAALTGGWTQTEAVTVAAPSIPPQPLRGPLWRRKSFRFAGAVAAAVLGAAGVARVTDLPERVFRGSDSLPRTSNEWYLQGQKYLERYDRQDYTDHAIESLEKAVEMDRSNAAAEAALAQAYLAKRSETPDPLWAIRSRDAATRAAQLAPYLAEAHSSLGAALVVSGDLEKGLISLNRALELEPLNPHALRYLAMAYDRQGKRELAEQTFQKAITAAPQAWRWVVPLGEFLYRQGRLQESVEVLQRAGRMSPNNAMVNRSLGAVYHALGKDDQAASAFQRSLEVAPSQKGYSNLGTLLFYMGKYQDSVQAFEKASELDANGYITWGNLADAYRWTPGYKNKAKGAYETAVQLLRPEIDKAPGNGNMRSTLATYLVKLGDTRGAQEQLRAIDEKTMKQPGVLFKAAVVQELSGNRKAALDLVSAALKAGYAAKEIDNEPELLNLRKDPEYHRRAAMAGK